MHSVGRAQVRQLGLSTEVYWHRWHQKLESELRWRCIAGLWIPRMVLPILSRPLFYCHTGLAKKSPYRPACNAGKLRNRHQRHALRGVGGLLDIQACRNLVEVSHGRNIGHSPHKSIRLATILQGSMILQFLAKKRQDSKASQKPTVLRWISVFQPSSA